MKTFLKRTGLVILAMCLVFGVGYGLMSMVIHQVGEFPVQSGITDVYVGHSEIASGIDDSILDHGKNIAKGGEGYLYAYLKLKNALDQNTHINRVFIAFSNNLAYKKLDRWIWDKNHLNKFGSSWMPFFSPQDLSLVIQENPVSTASILGLTVKKLATRLALHQTNYLDTSLAGFYPKHQSIVDSLIVLNERHKPRAFNLENVEASLSYINEMIMLCKQSDIEVYLIRTPLHSSYEGFQYEGKLMEIRRQFFSDVLFLDFSRVPFENDEFADFNHLSAKGAKRFSLFLNDLVEKNQFDTYLVK